MNGVLIIDKPAGLTSHDVVNRARRILQERSVGHLGTLDPMATGVLPLVTGTLTRLAQFYTASEKTYEGTVRFGFSTDTYDAEGEATSAPQQVSLRADEVEALASRFRGVIEQIPPPFSAKKIHGVPAYKLARQQKEVVLKPVQVEIKEFEILAVEADRARFRARVASGTYIRSVAHEMGRELACGAHLESLRRTSVAEFNLEDAHTLDQVADAAKNPNSLDDLFAHHDRLNHVALLHPGTGKGILHRGHDDITDARVSPARAAEHTDTQDLLGTGVVGDFKPRLLLDHVNSCFLTRGVPAGGGPPRGSYLAFSRISATRQCLVAESGRVSISRTRSPTPQAFSASCAWYFLVRRMTLPYLGCFTRSSTRTTTVLSILSLTT